MKLVISALLLTFAVPAAADPADPAPMRKAVIEAFDRNGDGRLEPREQKRAMRVLRRVKARMAQAGAPRGKRMQQLIQRYDVNRDGHLGPEEVPPGLAKRLRKHDRDRDGWVEPDEAPSPRD